MSIEALNLRDQLPNAADHAHSVLMELHRATSTERALLAVQSLYAIQTLCRQLAVAMEPERSEAA